MTIDFSLPGKPTDKANCRLADFLIDANQECLNAIWFMKIEDAKEKIESWRRDYNWERPHGSLGFMTPFEYAQSMRILEDTQEKLMSDFLPLTRPRR